MRDSSGPAIEHSSSSSQAQTQHDSISIDLSIPYFDQEYQDSRRLFSVLPACHDWSRWDFEPEETAHPGNIGPRENDRPPSIFHRSFSLAQILDSKIIHAAGS